MYKQKVRQAANTEELKCKVEVAGFEENDRCVNKAHT